MVSGYPRLLYGNIVAAKNCLRENLSEPSMSAALEAESLLRADAKAILTNRTESIIYIQVAVEVSLSLSAEKNPNPNPPGCPMSAPLEATNSRWAAAEQPPQTSRNQIFISKSRWKSRCSVSGRAYYFAPCCCRERERDCHTAAFSERLAATLSSVSC